jgi:hypothetical protein
VRQFPSTVPLLYIIFENLAAERHNAKRDYVHLHDRTARTEPKTRCPTKQPPRGKYHWIIIAHKRREREQIGDVRAGDKRRPLVQHGP